MKNVFLLGVVICFSLSEIFSQSYKDTIPIDPIIKKIWGDQRPLVKNNTNDFLILEDSCYDFHVHRIISLPAGHLIIASTYINNHNVKAHIVTSKKRFLSKANKKKVAKGKTYKLRLRRYHLIPAWVGIESGSTVDVMLGEKTISINQNGWFSYLFTSFCLDGLYQDSEEKANLKIQKYLDEENNIKRNVYTFLNYISFGLQPTNLYDILDTSKIKNSFKNYGHCCWGRKPADLYNVDKRYKWKLDYPVEKLDWKHSLDLDPNCFMDVFWGMLKKSYHLPVRCQFDSCAIISEGINLKLLNCSEPDVYTVQVIWKILNINKTYIAILNIQKAEGKYKIIGFNRVYNGYRQYMTEGNEKFVPY